MLFGGDYYLRWWRLPIEERACRKTDLGGGDYYLRNSGLRPYLKQCTFLAQFFKVCSNWKQELDFNILDAKKTLIKKMSNMHRWYLNIDPGFCRIWRTQRSYPASLQETVRNLKYQTCFVMHGEDFSSIYMKCNFSIRRTEMEQGRFNISFKDDVPSPTDVPWISLDGLWRKVL